MYFDSLIADIHNVQACQDKQNNKVKWEIENLYLHIFVTSENQEETWLMANFRKEPCMYMGKEIKDYS